MSGPFARLGRSTSLQKSRASLASARRRLAARWLTLRRHVSASPIGPACTALAVQAILLGLLILAPIPGAPSVLAVGAAARPAILVVAVPSPTPALGEAGPVPSPTEAPPPTATPRGPTTTEGEPTTPGASSPTPPVTPAGSDQGAVVQDPSGTPTTTPTPAPAAPAPVRNSPLAPTATSAPASSVDAASTGTSDPGTGDAGPGARPATDTPTSTPTPTTTPSPTATVKPQASYRLPWPAGEGAVCVQGNNGPLSHRGLEAFAWDFSLPTGSVVEAARAGTVRFVRDDSNIGGPSVPLYGSGGNYVVVDHGDGTSALYMHLMVHGALVRSGQWVEQGQPIAYSGDTGYSTGPHLHFQVEQTTGSWLSQSLPVAFADVASENGVPVANVAYTSGNARADYWRAANPVGQITLPAISLRHADVTPLPGVQGTGRYLWPVAGPILVPFGPDELGVDVAAPQGAAVVAADSGTVVYAGADPGGWGATVTIDHGNGAETVYARLGQASITAGSIVLRGQPIGVVGILANGLPSFATIGLYQQGQWANPAAVLQVNLPDPPLPDVVVPNLVGLSPAQARTLAQSLTLQVTVDAPQPSDSVSAGMVASQAPEPGTKAPIRSALHIVPSAGAATTTTTPAPATSAVTTTVSSATQLAKTSGTTTAASTSSTLPVATAGKTPTPRPTSGATPARA